MKKVIGLIIFILFIVAGVIFASPYWALYQLKNAYDAKDVATINRYINFPSVQTSVKNQLTPVLVEKAQRFTGSPLLQAMNIDIDAEGMITKMVNQAVDNTVTENGVNTLITGQASLENLDNNTKLLGGLTAVAMDKVNISELITARNQDELARKVAEQINRPNPNAVAVKDTAKYCGFNCFKVETQVRGYPLTVQMQRQGLIHWQIVDVRLPLP